MALVYQVTWAKCNVFDKDGNPTVYSRNDLLPDGVDPVQLSQLNLIGAVRIMESMPTEEELRAEMAQSQESAPAELAKPEPSALKPDWVKYASDPRNPNRISAETADSMSKSALVDKFKD